MNISYRNLWNPILGTWVAVSELTRARGKRSGGSVALAGAALMLMGSVPTQGFAQTSTWLPASGTFNWNEAANWSTGTTPDASNAVVVNQGTARLDVDTTIGSLESDNSASGNVLLANSATLTTGGNDASTTYAGRISGDGNLIKTGVGTLTLTGNNILNNITVADGTLQGDSNSLKGFGTFGGTLSVNNGASIVFDQTTNGSYSGDITGGGSVTKSGTGTLTMLANLEGFFGTLTVADGVLQSHAGALKHDVINNANVTFNQTVNASYGYGISGSGSVTKIGTSTLTLTSGNNTYSGGTIISAGTLALSGSAYQLQGEVNLNGVGANFDVSGLNGNSQIGGLSGITGSTVTLGSNTLLVNTVPGQTYTYAGSITGNGALRKSGAGTQILTGSNNYTGGTIVAGQGILQGNSTSLQGDIAISNANATVVFDQNTNGSYVGNISGVGRVTKEGAGNLTLSGNNSHSGATTINDGTLSVNGSLSNSSVTVNNGATLAVNGSITNAVTINDGATLSGNGTVGNTTVASGGVLAPGSTMGALTVAGNLTLDSGSQLNFAFGAPGTQSEPGSSNQIQVNGNLNLNGTTLNVSDAGNFGAGLYRLFNYTGTLSESNGGIILGSTPIDAANLLIQRLSAQSQINLINTSGLTLSYWNGNGQAGTGQSGGGDGTWSNASQNWTDAFGLQTAAMQPQPGFAIFAGDAGDVTVDNSDGDVEITGLQFASNGYNLHGDTLTLSGDGIVRVGDGTAVGASYVATINNVIDGSSGLTKTDLGTLVLTNANTYIGTTTINAGTLAISADEQLGDAGNQLSFNGGTLQTTADLTTARATTLDTDGGTLNVDSGTTLSHQGDIDGVGGLTKSGDGMLVLSGVNTYSGATTINTGTLQAGASNTLSSDSALVLANTADALLDLNGFDQTIGSLAGGGAAGGNVLLGLANLTTGGDNTSTTYAGAISGDGNLNKVGTGAWTLSGDNSNYSGTTSLTEGTLILGSNNALGTGLLHAADGTTLDASTAVSISNELDLAGNLNIGGTADLTLNGAVNGTGNLTKNGNANLTLNVANGYVGDTVLNAGTLTLGNASALGLGDLSVTGSAILDNNTSLDLSIAIALHANLTIGGSNALTLNGNISGTGGLIKDGNAMLTLSGVNNYSGSTTINNGVLQAGANNTLSGNSAVVLADVAGAALDLNGYDQAIGSLAGGGVAGGNVLLGSTTLTTGGDNTSTTYAGVISGDGTLVKTGTGTMTLSGANTHSTTKIENGTLQAGAAHVFASNSTIQLANIAGVNLVLDGHDQSIGALMDDGQQTGSKVDLGTATLTIGNENMSSFFNGDISGSGSLVKVGSGDLVLLGSNNYSGGTTISEGVLVGDTRSLQGDIVNNALTVFLQGHLGVGTYAGEMSGSGKLSVESGKLILSNSNNSYSGGTEISNNAILQGDSRSLQGNILINNSSSSVIFAQGVDGTYAGIISGFGDLIKEGTGNLTLSGANIYNGNTSINEGSLTVNGSLSNDSIVLVGSGATLDGSGSVGSIMVVGGGTLASGNSTGALTINGTLQLGLDSQLNFVLGSPNNSNQIQVNGNLYLGGSTLNVSDAGNFGPGLYRLISYTGTLTEDNGGIALGSTPADATNLSIQSLSAQKQINLINTSGLTLNYWNGNGQASANQSGGGDGVWSNTSVNWTDDVGSMSGPMQPQPGFAIFTGDAGMIGIDNSAGNVEVTGMQFASDGYTLDGDTLTLGGTGIVRVGDAASADYVATINNVIDGNVGLTKTDGGTLVLNGENTYTGGTAINGGTISINRDANLGDASGHLSLNGGTLLATSSLTTARATTLGASGGTFAVDYVNDVLTHHGDIDGTGSLTKTGDGTLLLTGSNTYSGGTTVAAGMLAGDSNSLQGNILNNAHLVFDQTTVGSGTYTGEISGNGKLSVGTGTLILSGTNSYSGGTDVYDATLQGDSRSLQGNIFLTGLNLTSSVIFAQGINGTYAGTLSGDGNLIKEGSGNLTLSGNNTYSGDTAINNGTLTVNGSISNSLITVNNGGTLGGSGTVTTTLIEAGGVLAPGNTSGVLTVDGALAFAPGSSYRVQVDADGRSDRVNVSDIAILAGGTVDVRASSGNYAANTTYTILNAANGLSGFGTFDGVTSNLAFLTPTLSYDTNNVFLNMERNSVSYSTIATTSNQLGISRALESAAVGASSDMNAVQTALTGLSADQARRAYDSMSGASLSAMSRAGAGFSAGVGSQMRARLAAVSGNSSSAYAFGTPVQLSGKDHVYDLFSAASTASPSSSTSSSMTGLGASADSSLANYGRGFWLRGYGNYQSTSSDGNAVASTVRSNGLSVGFDTEVSEGLIVGVAGTFGKSSLRFDSNDSGRSRDRALAAYASYKTGPWNFNGSANFAFNSSNMERQIVVGALTRTATSAFDGHTASVYGEATYDIQMQDWMLQPLAALSLSRSKTDGFTEQGAGALNLQVAGQTTNSVKTLFGAKAQFEVGQVKLEPRLAWGHEFGDANAPMTMQFAGSAAPSFLISGVKLPRDSVIAGLGLSSNISKRSNSNLSLFADIQGEYNSRQSNVALLVGIRSRW